MEKRNNNEQKKIDNVLYILGLSGTVICCVYLLISKITGFRIENYLYPCLFHTVTGYYCPGCGGTRAVCALFQGHFLISFLKHPFVPYAAVLCAWFLLSQTIERLSHHKLSLAMHYKDRSVISRQVTAEIAKYFGEKVYPTPVPRNVKLVEAPSFGKPVSVHAPRSSGATAYKLLADEFLKREESQNGTK